MYLCGVLLLVSAALAIPVPEDFNTNLPDPMPVPELQHDDVQKIDDEIVDDEPKDLVPDEINPEEEIVENHEGADEESKSEEKIVENHEGADEESKSEEEIVENHEGADEESKSEEEIVENHEGADEEWKSEEDKKSDKDKDKDVEVQTPSSLSEFLSILHLPMHSFELVQLPTLKFNHHLKFHYHRIPYVLEYDAALAGSNTRNENIVQVP